MEVISVAPLAGAWIEIVSGGLHHIPGSVAPLAGAWIEMSKFGTGCLHRSVAPLAGAWIEIVKQTDAYALSQRSLPSRERGLK